MFLHQNLNIMLKRKIHSHLIEWKNRGDKKVLIITGARQVGKTTAIREFAKENYTHFLEVNFVKHPVAKQAFDADLDTNQEKAVPDFVHKQMSKVYQEFLVIGGMPEVVQKYIDNPDISNAFRAQKSIITTYRDDISHYAEKSAVLVKRVFDAMPSQLGKQDKRFVLAEIEKGASLRKYEAPTQWLIDAGLAYYSFNTKAFELPFESTENRKLYKLYMVDTGLLCSQMINEMQFEVLKGNIDINEGALTENFVACALSAKGKSLHYYDKKSKQELDFIIQENNKITILEVKSGDNYKKHASLDAALNSFSDSIGRAIVLCKNNVEKSGDVTYMPLYMAMFL